jgi:RimJ/RimL family protein N-acetyltransferase
MFLPRGDYELYGAWLRQQDDDTLRMYFGIAVGKEYVNELVKRIVNNNQQHHFLVAFDHERWIGVLHIADCPDQEVEFGFIVDHEYRGHGVADRLMDEGVTWCQNRGYQRLFLHCLSWNQPIKHLCLKHGLELREKDGDTEVDIPFAPASFISLGKEAISVNRNIFTKMLEQTWKI